MPKIRDKIFTFETVTTDAGLTIPAINSVQNDLLLAFIVSDTGTPTYTPPAGWTQIFQRVNTCSLTVFRKIATSSEPSSYTFAANVNETYSGALISISDVDTTTPINTYTDVNQSAVARINAPQITTNRDNCLILYALGSSGTVVPSWLEGPVESLIAGDGAAESLGIGAGFKAAQGSTPNNVYCLCIGSNAGVLSVLAINPPSGGASIIPTYLSQDSSVLLDVINGVTGYNGNTAMAITADTNFGTTLGAFTANDATLAASTDLGINSFHPVCRVSNTGGTQVSGSEIVFSVANRPNVTNKNILIHGSPSTEGQLQRSSTITSGKGIWLGLRSAAANDYKIWQVYGVELGGGRHKPYVINSGAGNLVASAGTLNASSVQAIGFWNGGASLGVATWEFAMAWLLDTIKIVGGNSSNPIGIKDIYQVSAQGKERFSMQLQGSNQLISYSAFELGDNGANPIYANLDSCSIEFPGQYDSSIKEVQYNSIDNVAGITYNAGSSGTIKHTNSIISSRSRYHWRIESGASGTYDFTGLTIIGAGQVILRDITSPSQFIYSNMTFSNCGTIQHNSALMQNCQFIGGRDSITLTTTNPSLISDSSFISDGTGHAIEITGTATNRTLTNIDFSGYTASNGSTGNEAIYVNIASGSMTITIDGGTTPSIRTAGATVTVVTGQVTTTITVKDVNTGSNIQNARVYLIADAGGPLSEGTVIFNNLTNASGQVSDTRSLASDQPVVGWVRKSSSAPYYKNSPITGTIDNITGLSLTVQMIPDE